MAQGQLTITYASLTLALETFENGTFPSEEIDIPQLSRSRNGARILDGTTYRPARLWDISAVISEDQLEIAQIMMGYWLDNRSTEAIIDDEITKFAEQSQTREAVSGASITTRGDGVIYYARFNAVFTAPISTSNIGVVRIGAENDTDKTLIMTTQLTETTPRPNP